MKASKRRKNPRVPRARRATFAAIAQEMRRWSALLETELMTWPDVNRKAMFGFLRKIFAALPRRRGFNSSSSLIVRFNPMPPAALLAKARADARMGTNTRVSGKGWFSFEVASECDLRDALAWLDHAYQAAKK
ncbi:MAG TPA: hypothetical protein VKB61_13455 [Candidatus Acidoferrum sp.]|nr:hypothetical protein [Candidatus Acidoferrum sp.]